MADMADVTSEGALRQVLRCVPDAVPQGEHNTEAPTLDYTQRSAAAERPYDFADGVQVACDPHSQLALPVRGVVIDHVTTIFGQQAAVHDAAGLHCGG